LNIMDVRKPEIVALTALASSLGISARRAREHAATGGVFVKAGRGYDLEASRLGYMATLRRAATGRRGEGKAGGGAARERLATAQAIAIETKNKLATRQLISEAEVESTWLEIVARARAAVLAAPSRIHADLPHLSKFDVSTIDRHLRDALTRLAAGP
jgi:phage terminase Nu1 subunit (DNA packaging protein)